MNKIKQLFQRKRKNILSIYFTAGFPKLGDTTVILNKLQQSGVDMVEVGMPFSDPLADGKIIQHASEVALKNGMNLSLLFQQLKRFYVKGSTLNTSHKRFPVRIKNINATSNAAYFELHPPVVLLMGYFNTVLQYGVERFCRHANRVGVSGVILPDLPADEYYFLYKTIFEKYGLKNIFMITPQTSEKRIHRIDKISDGFIYAVSSSSTTGTNTGIDNDKIKFFRKINKMKLRNPVMIGFGISDKKSFKTTCKYANGAIIGSAFIRALENRVDINLFINSLYDHTIRK